MAPSKKRTKGWLGKERIIEPRYSRRQLRKPATVSRRGKTYQTINVPEMVYRFLTSAKHNQGRGENVTARRGGGRFHGNVRKYRNPEESSCDTSPVRDSTISVDGSKYTKSGATSTENLSRVMDATNSSRGSVSWNSSVSNISVEPITLANTIDNTRALLKKKSLVQVINSYIKAGIEEGKRQAKKYIRKALSFGMKSGYLIPADPQGQVIHVSPALVEDRRSDVEARKRRRRTRRGEDDPFTDRRERRKETPPLDAKRKRHREPTPLPVVPLKRRKKGSSSRNLETKLNPAKPPAKKKPVEPVRKTTKKKDAVKGRRGKMTHTTLPTPSKQRSREKTAVRTRSKQQTEVVERRRSRSKRISKSPSTRNNDRESRRKDVRRSSNEDEDSVKLTDTETNRRTTTERRRSGSSPEELPRECDVSPGNPGKEVEECLEAPNNEDDSLRNLD